jgi:hypothetical protein
MALREQLHDAPIAPGLPGDKGGPIKAEGDLFGNRRRAVVTQEPVPISIGVVKAPDDKASLEAGGQRENIPAVHMTADESAAPGVLGGPGRHGGREAVGIFPALPESEIAQVGGSAGFRHHLFAVAGWEAAEDNSRMAFHTGQ